MVSIDMSPFEAFKDVAGRLGWDTQQQHAGGLFRDASLQSIWDAFARNPVAQPSAPLGWVVREKRGRNGELLDCFVEAPQANGMAYGLEVLGDDYTGYGDVEGKLTHCKLIVAWANALSGRIPTWLPIAAFDYEQQPRMRWLIAQDDIVIGECFWGAGPHYVGEHLNDEPHIKAWRYTAGGRRVPEHLQPTHFMPIPDAPSRSPAIAPEGALSKSTRELVEAMAKDWRWMTPEARRYFAQELLKNLDYTEKHGG